MRRVRRPWWWLRATGDEPEDLNEPTPASVRVPTKIDHHGEGEEFVFAEPDAVGHWDQRVWRARP